MRVDGTVVAGTEHPLTITHVRFPESLQQECCVSIHPYYLLETDQAMVGDVFHLLEDRQDAPGPALAPRGPAAQYARGPIAYVAVGDHPELIKGGRRWSVSLYQRLMGPVGASLSLEVQIRN